MAWRGVEGVSGRGVDVWEMEGWRVGMGLGEGWGVEEG